MLMKKFITSIPLVIMGILIIICIVPINHIVQGITWAFAFVLANAYIAVYILITIISSNKSRKSNEKFNFMPTIVTVIFIVIISFLIFRQCKRNNAPVYMAAFRKVSGHGGVAGASLILYKDSTYKVELIYLEASAVYHGTYTIKNDTLVLLNSIAAETDSVIADKYVINNTNLSLLPVMKSAIDSNRAAWLKIEPQE
jgi:hypothetical protein